MYYAEQNAKNKMAWVPTTDAQARTYFYNLYTRETRWVPPHGAPRVELEWWEKTYAERKAPKKKRGVEADKGAIAEGDGDVPEGGGVMI